MSAAQASQSTTNQWTTVITESQKHHKRRKNMSDWSAESASKTEYAYPLNAYSIGAKTNLHARDDSFDDDWSCFYTKAYIHGGINHEVYSQGIPGI